MVSMRGDLSLGKTLVSLKVMLRTIRHKKQGMYVELSQLEVGDAKSDSPERSLDILGELFELLSHYQHFFQLPAELPPILGHEHSIILKEG